MLILNTEVLVVGFFKQFIKDHEIDLNKEVSHGSEKQFIEEMR